MNFTQKKATRIAYGEALVELGKINDKVVVLDADLSGSTKTAMFKKEFPDRFINCGIAEANMISVAAGIATTGLIPFASTFAMFASGRAFDQIRNSVAYPKLNVKICATHAGITVGEDGATHQCIEDLSIMRTIPNMTVINPADATEAKKAVHAIAQMQGPVYMRLGRSDVPIIFNDDYDFVIGKGVKLTDGNDVTIIATGIMVEAALIASEQLKNEGISARVVNISTIKPIDRDIIIDSAVATGAIVTTEEHNVIGGLGAAVCEVICESVPCPVIRHGIYDRFGRSGNVPDLLEYFELTPKALAEKAKEAIRLKNR